jgi:hypothetical protein
MPRLWYTVARMLDTRTTFDRLLRGDYKVA